MVKKQKKSAAAAKVAAQIREIDSKVSPEYGSSLLWEELQGCHQ